MKPFQPAFVATLILTLTACSAAFGPTISEPAPEPAAAPSSEAERNRGPVDFSAFVSAGVSGSS